MRLPIEGSDVVWQDLPFFCCQNSKKKVAISSGRQQTTYTTGSAPSATEKEPRPYKKIGYEPRTILIVIKTYFSHASQVHFAAVTWCHLCISHPRDSPGTQHFNNEERARLLEIVPDTYRLFISHFFCPFHISALPSPSVSVVTPIRGHIADSPIPSLPTTARAFHVDHDNNSARSSLEDSSRLLRGTIVNRTYGAHKNPYIYIFLPTIFGPIYDGSPQ